MERTEKNCTAQSAPGARSAQPERVSAYRRPTIETVEIRVERGFEGSLEELPDTPWENY